MKYCTESSGKPTISGMKIPSVNDWAHETVWVIKMLCRTELKILTGLSVCHCLKDVLGLDSGSNIECRHHSELLLRMEGGRYHVQYLVSLLFSSIFILAVPAERSSSLLIYFIPGGLQIDWLLGVFFWLFVCCSLFFKPVCNDGWEGRAREGTALKSSLYIYLWRSLCVCVCVYDLIPG